MSDKIVIDVDGMFRFLFIYSFIFKILRQKRVILIKRERKKFYVTMMII